MAHDYVIKYGSLLGGVFGEVPVSQASWTTTLNKAGTFSITFPIDIGVTYNDLTPGGSVIWILSDGVPRFSGIVWTASVDPGAGTVTVNGEGWLSYFARRNLTVTRSYAGVEQVDIMVDLLDWAQSVSGGDVGIVTSGNTATGVLRDRIWLGSERQNIATLITNLADVINGPGFRFTPRDNGVSYEVVFETVWPTSGNDTGVTFELGSNVNEMTVTFDGAGRSNAVEVIGGGTDTVLVATVTDPDLGVTAPRLEYSQRISDVTEPTTLVEIAQAALATRAEPIPIPTLTVHLADFGDATPHVGDVVGVRANLGYLQLDDRYLVVELKVDLTPAEIVTLTLAPVGTFA